MQSIIFPPDVSHFFSWQLILTMMTLFLVSNSYTVPDHSLFQYSIVFKFKNRGLSASLASAEVSLMTDEASAQ